MMYIVGIAAIALLPVLWSVLVHPLRSAATLLKVVLSLAGILYLIAAFATGDFFSYGVLGGLLLVCACLIGFFQARRAA